MKTSEHSDLNDKSTISIDYIISSVGVSMATVRNWIKLGYLKKAANGHIDRNSFDKFCCDVIGKQKLTNRANKIYKYGGVELTKLKIKSWQNYESSLSDAHRNREGIYYTPMGIVADMISKIDDCDISDKIFLDPCCGSGNFLIKALEMGASPQNLYGYDIDPNAVKITKYRIKEMSGYTSQKIICGDFLERANSMRLRPDYIFTNPPWGKKINRKDSELLAQRYGSGRSLDSSSLFIMASLKILKEGGTLGFLLQEALFNICSYSDIRRCLLEYQIDYFIDYGRAFKPIQTKAQALILTKSAPVLREVSCIQSNKNMSYKLFYRSYDSFLINPNSIFNFSTSPNESAVIEMLFNQDYTSLKGCAKWGLGVVTGDNNRFCSDTPKDGFVAVYRGADITPNGFKAASMYIDGDLTKYQQAAPLKMYNAPKKIVYKFISSNLCFYCDTEQRLILNSANLFILNDEYPIDEVELTKLLNSDFMNWLFKSLFSTHKVLRDNIESLPIFLEYFDNGKFNEEYYIAKLGIERVELKSVSYRLKS